MAEKQEPGIGSGVAAESAPSASPATAGNSAPSPRTRRSDTAKISPVEALEILASAFNQVAMAGIPTQALRSHDSQILIYKVGARQCPLCQQPRPLWNFIGNICKECQP